MKKFLSNKKTAIALFVVTLLFLGFYAYMLARPVSYGMAYSNSSVYEGETFHGELKFSTNAIMLTKNNSYPQGDESFYYYKNGRVFFLMATTKAEYKEEVSQINADFEGAVENYFSAKMNAFRVVASAPDGFEMAYVCKPAITFAAVGGVVALALLGGSVVSFLLYKKTKKEN
jgi:hypothetical protein